MTYAQQLQITGRAAWATWYECSDVATRYTETAINWYLGTFFSTRANDIYRDLGLILGDVMVLTIMAGMVARQRVQGWVDTTVEGCLDTEAEEVCIEPATTPVLRTAISLPWYAPVAYRGVSVALSVMTIAVVGAALLATMAARELPQFVVKLL